MEEADPIEAVRPSRAHRWLAPGALVMVAVAAVMGWGASFVGLHEYGQQQMTGYSWWTAWLIPGTFDGAAFGATLITYRASIYGRPALRGRLLMWVFTGISSWINWTHQLTPEAKIVASGLPVAAVAVFDIVLLELRADYEARHGRRRFRVRPGLLVLRWIVDRSNTLEAFRSQITSIPVQQLVGLSTGQQDSNHTTDTSCTTGDHTPDEDQVDEREDQEHEQHLQTRAHDEDQAEEPEPDRAPQVPAVPPRPVSSAPPGRAPKLPAHLVEQLKQAYEQAAAQGRRFTVADVHQVVRLPEDMAQQVVDEFTTHNGHAFA